MLASTRGPGFAGLRCRGRACPARSIPPFFLLRFIGRGGIYPAGGRGGSRKLHGRVKTLPYKPSAGGCYP